MIATCTTKFWRSRHRSRRPAAFFAALVVYIIVILVAAPEAQQNPAFSPGGSGSSPAIRDAASGTEIDLLVGRSTILNVGSPIARVSLTVPDIADAMVTAPTQLLIHGKQPGTISLFVWDKAGAIKTFEVKVRRDLSALREQLKQLFPGEDVGVIGSGKDVVLSGTVASKYVVEKAADVAAGYVDKKENVVNLLKQQEGVASNQVLLRVRFAEVSRSALQELGASFFANGAGTGTPGEGMPWFGRTLAGTPGPDFDDGRLVFSDFLNLFVFNAKENLGAVIRALSNKGLFQSLAEPNLIATNGKEASFLAGGEYPYPIVQPSSGGNSVTIMFKEFGVRLTFTPTVLGGDLIHLKVRPEVSSLDFANAVQLEGFRVPALSTRRTETEVELRDGQTFAIAGLLNNTLTTSMSKIPGIGDIPILGLLFRSKAHQKNQTELVVMITPSIVRRGQMGASEGLPSLVEPYIGPPKKTYPNPEPYVGSPRYPANQGSGRNGGNLQPPPSLAPVPPAPEAPAPVASRPVGQQPAMPPMPLPSSSPGTQPATTPAMPLMPPQSTQSVPPAPPQSFTQPAPMPPAAVPPAVPAPTSPAMDPPAAPLTKEQMKAIERARQQEQKAAEAAAREETKRRAEEQKRAEAAKRQADKIAKERAKREAEIARKNAETARRRAQDDEKREKALAEAATRLKEAQAAYQAELEKAKGSGNDNKTGKSSGGGR